MRGSIYGVIALVLAICWSQPAFGQVATTDKTNAEKPKTTHVTRLPYRAEYKLTTVKTLADGSTITHESIEVNYLDSAGRRMTSRIDVPVSRDEVLNTHFTVYDPVAETNTDWSFPGNSATVRAIHSNPVKPAAAHHPSEAVAPSTTSSTASVPPAKPVLGNL
jgi:hypothetical protein